LSVVDTGEVARARWLVFFWAKREGVGIHTWVWAASVVRIWLHLVEILTRLFLHAVLAVKHKLEGGHWADRAGTRRRPIFGPRARAPLGAGHEEWRTSGLGDWGEGVGLGDIPWVGVEDNSVGGRQVGGEVPGGGVRNGAVVEAPHQFLDWVIVRQAHLAGGTRGDRVRTSVLHLFDEVFVTLLGETTTLFGVKVDVVTPHLEGGAVRVEGEFGGEVEVEADFVVLEGNQRQVETWIAVEKEDQREKHSLC